MPNLFLYFKYSFFPLFFTWSGSLNCFPTNSSPFKYSVDVWSGMNTHFILWLFILENIVHAKTGSLNTVGRHFPQSLFIAFGVCCCLHHNSLYVTLRLFFNVHVRCASSLYLCVSLSLPNGRTSCSFLFMKCNSKKLETKIALDGNSDFKLSISHMAFETLFLHVFMHFHLLAVIYLLGKILLLF